MCGIVGMFKTQYTGIDRALLEKMNSLLWHRGPDDGGIFIEGQIGLGARRLAIIDPSDSGHQPMSNEDKSIWIVFNGEFYNHREFREELESKGHRYKSNSDTESIVHLYEEYGIDCLSRMNGMFAFAIWDRNRKKLFLARDRLGVKPLYYARINNDFCFGSEIKALLAHPDFKKEIDFQAMDQYFSYGAVPHPKTIYKGIFALEPGCLLEVDKLSVKKIQYWNVIDKLNAGKKSLNKYVREDEYLERITSMLESSIKLRLMSDVPLGVFLSGGVDSSLVIALMSKVYGGRIKTFSVGFEDGDPHLNELQYARIVSTKYATEHYEFIQTSAVAKVFPEVIRYFDEPFANPTAIPMYHISRLASDKVKVCLSGVGGDELFGGYPRYMASQWFRYHRMMPQAVRQYILSFITGISKSYNPYTILDRLQRSLLLERGSDASMYDSLRSTFKKALKCQFYTGFIKDQLKIKNDEDKCFIESIFDEIQGRNLIDRALFTDLISYLPTDLLTYCDRMSMASSLELRVPFCDYKLIELMMSIPSREKIKHFQLKYLLKKIAEKFLPKEIIHRKKQGFSVPTWQWIKTDLKPLINEFLSDSFIKRQGYFSNSLVKQMIYDFDMGKANYSSQIWTLLAFQMWHEQYMS